MLFSGTIKFVVGKDSVFIELNGGSKQFGVLLKLKISGRTSLRGILLESLS